MCSLCLHTQEVATRNLRSLSAAVHMQQWQLKRQSWVPLASHPCCAAAAARAWML
jgi:hypothetical protein